MRAWFLCTLAVYEFSLKKYNLQNFRTQESMPRLQPERSVILGVQHGEHVKAQTKNRTCYHHRQRQQLQVENNSEHEAGLASKVYEAHVPLVSTRHIAWKKR